MAEGCWTAQADGGKLRLFSLTFIGARVWPWYDRAQAANQTRGVNDFPQIGQEYNLEERIHKWVLSLNGKYGEHGRLDDSRECKQGK